MIRRCIVFVSVFALMAALASGLAQEKKGYTLRGKVEGVSAKDKTLTVNHEKVEGWMDAMTMVYNVDGEEIFKQVKTGDRITATVYDGDYTLHKVQVVPAGKKDK